MPDPAIAINITGNDADAARMIARQQRDIDKLKGAYRDLAHQGKETGESLQIGSGVAGEIAGLAAGYLSVSKALEIALGAHETWKSVLRETTQATRMALPCLVAHRRVVMDSARLSAVSSADRASGGNGVVVV